MNDWISDPTASEPHHQRQTGKLHFYGSASGRAFHAREEINANLSGWILRFASIAGRRIYWRAGK